MSEKSEIKITTRDKVLRAWENSTELTRDFKQYSEEIRDNQKLSQTFAEFAVDEGLHAARLLSILHEFEEEQ